MASSPAAEPAGFGRHMLAQSASICELLEHEWDMYHGWTGKWWPSWRCNLIQYRDRGSENNCLKLCRSSFILGNWLGAELCDVPAQCRDCSRRKRKGWQDLPYLVYEGLEHPESHYSIRMKTSSGAARRIFKPQQVSKQFSTYLATQKSCSTKSYYFKLEKHKKVHLIKFKFN